MAAVKEAVSGGASSEAVPGRARLDTLHEKVKAPRVSSAERINHLTVDGINSYHRGVMLQKTARTCALVATVIAGCAFGSGWAFAPRKKHLVKEEMMQ